MTVDEAIDKIRTKAGKDGMSGDDVYYLFLLGAHEQARSIASQLAIAETPSDRAS
jgi:hypothetical protein